MKISPNETYVRNLQKFWGAVDMGGVVEVSDRYDPLAYKMFAFVYTGLNTPFKISVAFFLVNQLTADQQTKLLLLGIERVEGTGFCVVRVVTDNLSVNVTMFGKLNDGVNHPVVRHPVQPYSEEHFIKSPLVFRSIFFFDRNLHIKGKPITPKFVRQLL